MTELIEKAVIMKKLRQKIERLTADSEKLTLEIAEVVLTNERLLAALESTECTCPKIPRAGLCDRCEALQGDSDE